MYQILYIIGAIVVIVVVLKILGLFSVPGRRAGVLDRIVSASTGVVGLITLLRAPLRREAHHASAV